MTPRKSNFASSHSLEGSAPASEYFRTLGYFRHLRSHYAHVNTMPTSAFATYVRAYGTPLNTFWNNERTDLHGVDFRTLACTTLPPDLAFGIMNLLRVCLLHVDHIVADTLSLGAHFLDSYSECPLSLLVCRSPALIGAAVERTSASRAEVS